MGVGGGAIVGGSLVIARTMYKILHNSCLLSTQSINALYRKILLVNVNSTLSEQRNINLLFYLNQDAEEHNIFIWP